MTVFVEIHTIDGRDCVEIRSDSLFDGSANTISTSVTTLLSQKLQMLGATQSHAPIHVIMYTSEAQTPKLPENTPALGEKSMPANKQFQEIESRKFAIRKFVAAHFNRNVAKVNAEIKYDRLPKIDCSMNSTWLQKTDCDEINSRIEVRIGE